jgi:hypothetical protein
MTDFPNLVQVVTSGQPMITLNAENGIISAGGKGSHSTGTAPSGQIAHALPGSFPGHDGGLQLASKEGFLRASLHGGSGGLVLREPPNGGLLGQEALMFSADTHALTLDVEGKHRIRFDAANADVWIGGNGANGDVMVFAENGDNTTAAKATIRMSGKSGDILFQNADCAEEFDLADGEDAPPGAIMVIGDDGRLHQCREPYDRRVVGIVSGAGSLKPAIILGRKESAVSRAALAVLGCVFCNVDATNDGVRVGDLLTTSARPGFAMKATDSAQSFGAVLGKALRAQASGLGLLPVLVALQ